MGGTGTTAPVLLILLLALPLATRRLFRLRAAAAPGDRVVGDTFTLAAGGLLTFSPALAASRSSGS